jgi:lysophospholipid acyltransferase (LPLAT)-like uncharacterized protein
MVPLPFSRVHYIAGPQILVPPDASPTQMEEKRQELENSLIHITNEADRHFS